MDHHYELTVEWTGDVGTGTSSYRGYRRDHRVLVAGKPPLEGSSDPGFHGDPSRHTPEDLLLASLSACHLLWYLHLCSDAGVVVLGYRDEAEGSMRTHRDGGEFTEVVLRPQVEVAELGMVDRALALHRDANRRCFIARSVRFPVRHEPVVTARHPATA